MLSHVARTIAFNHHACKQVDEGVVTLVNGWVVASANVPFIDLGSIPSCPSSIPPPALPLSAPLDVFRSGVELFCCLRSLLELISFAVCRRLVVVTPEVSSSPPPVPSSCSIYASSVYANEDVFRKEVQCVHACLRSPKHFQASSAQLLTTPTAPSDHPDLSQSIEAHGFFCRRHAGAKTMQCTWLSSYTFS